MKVNWRKFASFFALFFVVLMLSGCSASWLGAVSSLLPALEAAVSAIVSFALALEGKTVPAGVAAAIKKIGDDVAVEIQNVQALVAQFKAQASAGLLTQIQTLLQGVVTNLSSILSGLSISDASTIGKITNLVGLAVAAAQAIIALIPVAVAKMQSGASHAELQEEDEVASTALHLTTGNLKSAYHTIVTTPTENADVNAALASLPQSI
jgi:hypothetical protein